MLQKIKKAILDKWDFYRNRELPQTEGALRALAAEVCVLGGFPNNHSFLHAVASQLMHMDSQASSCKVSNFVHSLKRSIANQTAFAIIEEVKGRKQLEKAGQAPTA